MTGRPRPADRPRGPAATVPAMADETSNPIASTDAFRAFSADSPSRSEPQARRPSTLVYLTSIVLLVALVLGILAFAL